MTSAPRRALAAAVLFLAGVSPLPAAIVEEIVATVNGEAITMTEVEERERDIRAAIQSMSGAQKEDALDRYRDTLLVDLINERLLYQRGERLGLDLGQVYKSYLENFKQQNNIKNGDELMELLQQEGMTLEDFRTFLLRRFVPEIMINIEVREKIAVSEEEARGHYDAHRDEFTSPASYTFREIALLLREHPKAEALEIAGEIRQQALAGTDFESLVREHSESPSREQGGLVEDVTAPEMADAIRRALDALEVGGVSEPVETSLAVMLLKLESRKEAAGVPFDEVRAGIEAEIARSKYDEELEQYLRRLWAESRIKVMQKYRDTYPTEPYLSQEDPKPSS